MNITARPGDGRVNAVTANRIVQPLPRPRTNRSTVLTMLAAITSTIVSFLTKEKSNSTLDGFFLLVCFPFALSFVVEVGIRCLHAVEEYHHLYTRYENKGSTFIKDVFYFSPIVWVIALCCTIVNMKHDKCPILLWYRMGPTSMLTSLLATLLFSRLIKLESGPLYDSLWIEDSNGLNYGSGMAHSFFHGYLKLVIPNRGTEEKHLEELMKDYEATCGVKMVCYKLFILIPKSLYCHTSLKNDQYWPSIEESSSLEPKVITVAGVKDRVYKNSVYKIKGKNGKRIYISAEYATPLKTFKDVIKYNGEHSNYYKKYKNDILLQFYLTLQKILNEDKECKNYCELIYYEDEDDNGGYKDVGEVLLNRINNLRLNKKIDE